MRSVRCRNDGVNRRSNCRNFGGTDTGGYPHGKMMEKNFHPGGEAPPSGALPNERVVQRDSRVR
ncbi:hypothetical protein Mal33_54760 [Rosistilla oblonga]|uniref:Uncharacterized protein n=1 Tax=Rosistilla oblonga TaxID=2527990 RepID=A0A518J286_9BACT|nr:hypothetical protein Mal33_54760 [Rosistilla oblonga]